MLSAVKSAVMSTLVPRSRAATRAAESLLPLTGRVPAMAEPCRMHPSVYAIEAAVIDWARRTGLRVGPGVGFHRMAGRAFADFDVAAGTLFAQWLTWLFHLDDDLDEEGAPYPRLFDGHGEHPLESSFAELWRSTSAHMSDDWRLRFATHLQMQQDACAEEARNRAEGKWPSLAEYPAMRRATVGPFLYDLVEPCLGVEVPVDLHAGEPWQSLVDACNDAVAWCNDVASVPKERGDGHNLVVIAMRELELGEREAIAWTLDRIAERCADMRLAARRLRLDELDQLTARNVAKVACAYLAAPRAHLDWLLESARYA